MSTETNTIEKEYDPIALKEQIRFMRSMNELLDIVGHETDLMDSYHLMQQKKLPVSKRLRDYLASYIESGMYAEHKKQQEEYNQEQEGSKEQLETNNQ
jgi:hypothetical protein